MWNGEECPNYECVKKHPYKYFWASVKYFFNLKNKYHGIMIEWYSYKDGIISFTEFIQSAWRELWNI